MIGLARFIRFLCAFCVLAIVSDGGTVSARTGSGLAAKLDCALFSGWTGPDPVDDPEEKHYVSRTGTSYLLEFQGPNDEDEHGPVAAGDGSFQATFAALRSGRRYVLRTTISVERSERPFKLRAIGLRSHKRKAQLASIRQGERVAVVVPVTANSDMAMLFISTVSYHKIWGFASDTSLCAR